MEEVRRITIKIDPALGLGVKLQAAHDGVFIEQIVPGRSADAGKELAVGDRIAEINGQNVTALPNKQTLALLQQASLEASISLAVRRKLHEQSTSGQMQSPVSMTSLSSVTAANHFENRRQSTAVKAVRLPKSMLGLGLIISEGPEGPVIHSIMPDGVAARNGTLQVGDTIVKIDDSSLVNIPIDDAVRHLGRAKFLPIDRQTTTVTLNHAQGGFGIVFDDCLDGALTIKDVMPNSAAEVAGLRPGQELVTIGAHSVEGTTIERATKILNLEKVRAGGGETTVGVRSGDGVGYVTIEYMSTGTKKTNDSSVADWALYLEGDRSSVPSPAATSATSIASGDSTTAAQRLRQELLAEKQRNAMLENQLSLSRAAQQAAKATESDYNEIITLLEAEVAHLRAQLLASPDELHRQLIEYRRRCITLGCQVNKAVEAQNVTKSALQVMTSFAQTARSALEDSRDKQRKGDQSLNMLPDGTLRHRPFDGPLPPTQGAWAVGDACLVPWTDGGDGTLRRAVVKSIQPKDGAHTDAYDHIVVAFTDPDTGGVSQIVPTAAVKPLGQSEYAVTAARSYGLAHKLPGEKDYLTPLERQLLQNATGAIEKATILMESDTVLPFGMEEAFTADGTRYFIDHVNQSTSWHHPNTGTVATP